MYKLINPNTSSINIFLWLCFNFFSDVPVKCYRRSRLFCRPVFCACGKVFLSAVPVSIAGHHPVTFFMEKELTELKDFLSSVIEKYPPLPRAADIETRIENAIATRRLIKDYEHKARYKIRELFGESHITLYKNDIHRIATECLRQYRSKTG